MIHVDNLVFEITRQCNMNCLHCLRGEAENLNISLNIIEATLDKVKSISTITFSGGEPSLNVEAMKYTLTVCKKRNIPVSSFYVVTNGKKVSDEFINILQEWYFYSLECNYGDKLLDYKDIPKYHDWIKDDFFGGVALSSDKFHDKIPFRNLAKLQSLSFFVTDNFTDFDKTPIINMGKAENLSCEKTDLSVDSKIYFYDEDTCELLYINVKGDVLGYCDLSYEKQEIYKKTNVLTSSWDEELKEENNEI